MGCLNEKFAGPVAGKEIQGAGFQIEGRAGIRFAGREDFQGGEFAEAQAAQFRQLDHGPAEGESADPFLDMEFLADVSRAPLGPGSGPIDGAFF
jgi:hypothetical protein